MTPTPPSPERFTERQSSAGSGLADLIAGGVELVCWLVEVGVSLLGGLLG